MRPQVAAPVGLGGDPAIHGVEPDEADIWMDLAERVGHTLVLGTTRVGKTRLAELLITPTGIGDIISYSQSVAEYDKMYAAIFAIIVSSVLFIELLEKTEQVMFKPEKRN